MRPRTCTSSKVPPGTPWIAALAPDLDDIPVVQQCLLRHHGEQNGWIEDGLMLFEGKKVINGIWYCAVFPHGEVTRGACKIELLNMGYETEEGLTLHGPERE